MKLILKYAVTAMSVASVLGGARAAEAPPLDAYGELSQFEDAAISPDGSLTAAVVRIKGERRIVAIDGQDKPFVNISAGPGKVRSIQWADDKTVLLTTTSTVPVFGFTADKYELTGTIILAMKPGGVSGSVFANTDSVARTTRGQYGIRSIDGRTVGFFGGIALQMGGSGRYMEHGRTTLYGVDLSTNRARAVAPPPGEDHFRDWLIDTSGKVGAMLDVSEIDGGWRITGTKSKELARGTMPTGDISLISFGHDGSSVIYQTADDQHGQRWFEVPIMGGDAKEIVPGIAIDRVFVDKVTGRLQGYRTDGDTPVTVMSDPAQQQALTAIFRAFKGLNTQLMDYTPNFSKVLVRTSGNGDSGTWYRVDVAGKHAEPIGYERLRIAPEQVGPISLVLYEAQDGLALNGVLTLPPGIPAKNLPVIMLPHGGPAAHDTVQFDWIAQAFASRGYAVFQPNFRGSTGGSYSLRRAGDGEWGRKMQTDISDGLSALAAKGIVDPKRACIVGASYGGYAALAGVTLQHGIYRCAVAVAGISDLGLMYNTDTRESGGSKMLSRALKRQLGEPKGFSAVSPRKFAAGADGPIMLIHGKDDTVVDYGQSRVMADALKDNGKPFELITLQGEDHWLSKEETRKRMLTESMRFVQKYNPAN